MSNLTLLLLLGSVLLMVVRIYVPWVKVPEAESLARVSVPFRARIRLQRANVYSICVLLILGSAGQWLSAPLELLIVAAVLLILLIPVQYTLTGEGIVLGRTPQRRWSEFRDVEEKRSRLRLVGTGDWRDMEVLVPNPTDGAGASALMRRLITGTEKGRRGRRAPRR